MARSLVLVSLFVLVWSPLSALAQATADPCAIGLGEPDLPADMWPEGADSIDDPAICERTFRATPPGPYGVYEVRSLVMVAPSAKQAAADFAEYRGLLVASGWTQGATQPLGEETLRFSGSDTAAGIYAVQELFRRGNVVALVEASGTGVAANADVIVDLARIIDSRVEQDVRFNVANPLLRRTVWPNVVAPTMVADGRLTNGSPMGQGLQLGGFSGLVSMDREGSRFIAVTDRGPSLDVDLGKTKATIHPLPAFTPSIVKLELESGQLRVIERIGLRLPNGASDPRTGTHYVTGLPSRPGDPAAVDRTGRNVYGTDLYGLNPSGITVDPRNGSYWIADAYGPSILHVAVDGSVLLRLTPDGESADLRGINTRGGLPADLARRRPDRGFAGISISPDGRRLFAIMDSPLANPDPRTTETSRFVRLLTLDVSGAEPVLEGMYFYQTASFSEVGAARQDDVRVGDVVGLGASRLLVTERDSREGGLFKMVYLVDLAEATNLLSGVNTSASTLEQSDEHQLYGLGLRWAARQPLVNLAELGYRSQSFDGLAVVDESTIAAIDNDNFGFIGYDTTGRLAADGPRTRLSVIHLPAPLR